MYKIRYTLALRLLLLLCVFGFSAKAVLSSNKFIPQEKQNKKVLKRIVLKEIIYSNDLLLDFDFDFDEYLPTNESFLALHKKVISEVVDYLRTLGYDVIILDGNFSHGFIPEDEILDRLTRWSREREVNNPAVASGDAEVLTLLIYAETVVDPQY
jgi:hypothetical protein